MVFFPQIEPEEPLAGPANWRAKCLQIDDAPRANPCFDCEKHNDENRAFRGLLASFALRLLATFLAENWCAGPHVPSIERPFGRIACLARLAVDEDQLAAMETELNALLSWVETAFPRWMWKAWAADGRAWFEQRLKNARRPGDRWAAMPRI